MATQTLKPRLCFQSVRFTKQDGWLLLDVSVSESGKVALSGCNLDTKRTSIDVYSVGNFSHGDVPQKFYSKEFERYVTFFGLLSMFARLISLIDDDILTCVCDKLELINMRKDEVLRSRKVDGAAGSMSVRDGEIFISLAISNAYKISIYDVIDFSEIRSIVLEGIHSDFRPLSIAAVAKRLFVCESKEHGESHERVLVFDKRDGTILSELAKPTNSQWYVRHVTVCQMLGVAVVTWSNSFRFVQWRRNRIMFYSLLDETNSSFLTVETESNISNIKISDKGDMMIVKSHHTRDLRVYDMAEVFTYSNLKGNLSSRLQRDDCLKLTNFFALTREQTDGIRESEKPAENLLAVLEEKGCIEPYNVDRLTEAFHLLNVNSSCIRLVDLYRKTRTKRTVGSMMNTKLNTASGLWKTKTAELRSIDPEQLDDDQGLQKTAMWSVETTISNDGGFLEIENTDITLAIPPNALGENMPECQIRMRAILPGVCDDGSFSSNSSFTVELLPKNLRFQHPVELTLPHCLQWKEDVDLKARILMSYQEEDDEPKWEGDTDQHYVLDDKTCTIWLKRCGWIKYEIDDEIVEGKRIQIYAAAKPICVPSDIAEIAVGYHLDLPGAEEIPQLNSSFVIGQRKPFLFLREGNYPLTVSLQKIFSPTWDYSSPEENPKELPFRSVASSITSSCQFILQQNEKSSNIPTCMFKVSQNSDGVRLNIRPKVEDSQVRNVKSDKAENEASNERGSSSNYAANAAVRPTISKELSEKEKENVTASYTPSLDHPNVLETQQQFSTHRDYQMFPHKRLIKGPMELEQATRLINALPTMGNQRDSFPPFLEAMKEMFIAERHAQLGITTSGRKLNTSIQALMEDYKEHLGPKHPEYSYESNRVKSFVLWPEFRSQQPRELAAAGFFSLGFEDHVRCFYCGVTLGLWEPEEEPWEEHARHSARCQWLKRQKGQRFIDDVTKKYSNSEHILEGDLKSPQYYTTHAFAKNPNCCDEIARLETFTNWPLNSGPLPEILAQAGFFSRGTGDHVECFYCGLSLSHWEQQYEPWEEHARHNPRCQWLLEQKGQLFIDDVTKKYHPQQDTHDVNQVLKDDYGYSTDEDQSMKIFAKYPTYCFLGKRRDSFSNVPINKLQQLDTWTQAGFFCYGNGDQLTCFYCGKTVVNWMTENEPWEKHARLSPQCKWLLTQKGEQFVDEVEEKYKLKPLETVMQKLLTLATGASGDILDESKSLTNRVIEEVIENLRQVETKYALKDDGYSKDEDHVIKHFAKHPEFYSEVSRRDSFSNWLSDRFQQLDEWIEAGFFSNGNEDQVTCFCCGKTLVNWIAGVDPWKEHARLSPGCRWLLKQKEKHFCDEEEKTCVSLVTAPKSPLFVDLLYTEMQNLFPPATGESGELLDKNKTMASRVIEDSIEVLELLKTMCDEDGYSKDEDQSMKSSVKHPKHCFELGSRRDFSSNSPVENLQKLATWMQTGFFCHDDGDEVTCFHCGVTLDKAMVDDEPWEKHALLSPECGWLLRLKGQHFVDEVKKKKAVTQNPPTPAIGATGDDTLDDWKVSVDSMIEETEFLRDFSASNGEDGYTSGEDFAIKSSARYPNYWSEDSRRVSFSNRQIDKTEQLDSWVQAGFFFHGDEDQVTCFCCGETINEWLAHEEPWEKHALLSPDCVWLLIQKGNDFVDEVKRKHTVKQRPLQPGTGAEGDNLHQYTLVTNTVVEETINILKQLALRHASKEPEDLIKSPENLQCEICFDNDLAVAFHPCEHKAACKSCADKIETCPICHTLIIEKITLVIL